MPRHSGRGAGFAGRLRRVGRFFATSVKRRGAILCSIRFRLLIGALTISVLMILINTTIVRGVFEYFFSRLYVVSHETVLDTLASTVSIDDDGEIGAPYLSDLRYETPYSGYYWQIDFLDGTVLRSRSLWDAYLDVPELTADARTSRLSGPKGRRLVATERSIDFPETGRVHLIVASVVATTGEHRELLSGAVTVAVVFTGAIVMLVFLFQVPWSLNPILSLRGSLKRVMDGEDDFLEGAFGGELQPVATSFNVLLARYRHLIARARETAGNLSHAMKTPLAAICLEVEKLREDDEKGRAGGLRRIEEQLGKIEKLITLELARARAAGSTETGVGSADLSVRLDALLEVMQRLYAGTEARGGRGIREGFKITTDRPECFMVDADVEDLDEMLGNLLDNAFKWCRERISVEVSYDRMSESATIAVADDGPGLGPDEREKVFARGLKLDEATEGTGLGLAIARDLARFYGGDVSLDAGDEPPGLVAKLSLPARNPFRRLRSKPKSKTEPPKR